MNSKGSCIATKDQEDTENTYENHIDRNGDENHGFQPGFGTLAEVPSYVDGSSHGHRKQVLA